MNVCVIPARGGSKRIPRKNIKEFHGKPLIAYSIEAALKSNLFEHVIVSTDDDEIAKVATSYGAQVPFMRPEHLADDYANTFDFMAHSAQWIQEHWPTTKYVCCLYATAPFIQEQYLNEGFVLLSEHPDANYAYSVTEFPFPIQRSVRSVDGFMQPCFPENMLKRSQDLEPRFHDAAQFYWGTLTAFKDELNFFGEKSLGVELPRYLVVDIDTEQDWAVAEIQYEILDRT